MNILVIALLLNQHLVLLIQFNHTDKMAEEEIDFFKPHPHPAKPRVKTSFFEVVPDAFDDKSLNFTGDHRRVKKKVSQRPCVVS